MAGFAELPAFRTRCPRSRPLTDAGIRVACLTNGVGGRWSRRFVDRAGFGPRIDRVISVAEVLPVEAVRDGVPGTPRRCSTSRRSGWRLVAAHDWDCHGAKRAGLTTGWVSRKSGGYGAPFEPRRRDGRGPDRGGREAARPDRVTSRRYAPGPAGGAPRRAARPGGGGTP